MTQNFTVVETQTGKKGVHVTLKETLADVKSILAGKVDSLDPDDLMFIGTLKDVEEKLAAKHAKSAAKQANANPQNPQQPPAPQPNQAPSGTNPPPPANSQPTQQNNQDKS